MRDGGGAAVRIWPVSARVLRGAGGALAPFAEEGNAGGCYLRSGSEPQDLTGLVARGAVVDVLAEPRSRFLARGVEAGDGEVPGSSGWIARVNLFPDRHGWRWIEDPEGEVRAVRTLVSVTWRGAHIFALRAEFDALLLDRRVRGPEPRLRPVCRGACEPGRVVGHVRVRTSTTARPVHALLRVGPP